MIQLISVIANMHNGVGHHIPYHKSVGVAAELNGWEHFAVYSKEEVIQDPPKKWLPCLSKKGLYVHLGKHFFWFPFKFTLKMYGIINFTFLFKSLINGLRIRKEAIIFFDDPAPAHILSIFFSILSLKKKNINIWIMFRTPVYEKFSRLYLYKAILFASKKILGNEKIAILTDSEELRSDLCKYFVSRIIVMPIPHIGNLKEESKESEIFGIKNACDEILCWWPGSPRAEKGFKHILELIEEDRSYKNKFRLLVSETLNLESLRKSIPVTFIPDSLVRKDYEALMKRVDIVLLPYDPDQYGERTSGIFVEAIAHGALPIVTKNTWMAKELDKFNLNFLKVEWDSPNLGLKIDYILSKNNNELTKKMRNFYNLNHGEQAFARIMKEIS